MNVVACWTCMPCWSKSLLVNVTPPGGSVGEYDWIPEVEGLADLCNRENSS